MNLQQVISVRKRRTGKDVLGELVAYVLAEAGRVWIVMLLLGGIHHDISPAVPALGYWWTFGVLSLIDSTLTYAVTGGVKQAIRSELA